MRHRWLLGVIAVALLSACAGAPPQATTRSSPSVAVINSPTAVASTSASPLATASATGAATETPTRHPTEQGTEAATATSDENGAVTSTMAHLGITGERYAALGDPNAPLTIVEYSDYGCPFCRRYTMSTFPTVKEQYIDAGKVFYVYKDFPIVGSHPQAELAAEAAECAGEQGQYWAMHEQLFAHPEEWDTTADEARASFERYAGALGLNSGDLLACLSEGRYRAEVRADFDEAIRFGLNGTPSFVINGKLLAGAYPTEDFVRIVERELAGR